MFFNPDPKKQAQEAIFSRKRVKDFFFNDTTVAHSTSQAFRYSLR